MLVDVVMPKMGESIMEGTILKWHKKAGELIERDETLLEISTDKVDTEVPSPEGGKIIELLFKENDVVAVGTVIAKISTDVTVGTIITEKPVIEAVQDENITDESQEEISQIEKHIFENDKNISNKFYSPLVMNIAKKENISFQELERINGSGIEGRVTKKDLQSYIENKNKPSVKIPENKELQFELIKNEPEKHSEYTKETKIIKEIKGNTSEDYTLFEFDNIRQKMAEHMVESVSISPHVNTMAEVDLSNIEKIKNQLSVEFEKQEGFKLTYMPFICMAVINAIKDFPLINSYIDNSSKPFKALIHHKINIGIAVAMENGGLIVPVVKDSDNLNLKGLARKINDLGKRAKVKKLVLDEIQGGTFTISNYGVFGNTMGTMIINQPQVAILGIGAVKKRPVVISSADGDMIAIRPTMFLTLSFDHRLIDGALGGSFVMRVAKYLENFKI